MATRRQPTARQTVIRVGADGSALRAQLLGSRLREARGDRTLAEIGRGIDRTPASVSRWESGEQVPHRADLYYLASVLGVSDQERDELMALAQEAREPASEAISAAAADYDWLEGRATRVETWQDMVMPGFLQTADYARAALKAWNPDAPHERVERTLQARLARQRRLDGDPPLELSAVVSESVLRHTVGGPDVMRAQLHHLLDRARLPNVELRVIPFNVGAHPGFGGPFDVLRFATTSGRDLVWLTTRGGPVVFEDAQPFARAFKRIRAAALPDRKSVAMIAAMIRGAA